jgi:prevent-host-death family protein
MPGDSSRTRGKTLQIVTLTAAGKNIARLIEKVANEEEVILTLRSKPVARLVKCAEVKAERKPGSMKGKFEIGPEFFEPLPADELAAWEQSDDVPTEDKDWR